MMTGPRLYRAELPIYNYLHAHAPKTVHADCRLRRLRYRQLTHRIANPGQSLRGSSNSRADSAGSSPIDVSAHLGTAWS